MIKSKTIFVVGAGASAEAGFPVGDELTGLIAKRLIVDDEIRINDGRIQSAMQQQYGRGQNPSIISAAKRMREAMPLASSIDNYLDAHKSDDQTVSYWGSSRLRHQS